jgi:hypothetical protein
VAINQNFQQLDFFSKSPRDVSKDVIDWSEITGKFVDFINIERDRRMAAKAEIDKNISRGRQQYEAIPTDSRETPKEWTDFSGSV